MSQLNVHSTIAVKIYLHATHKGYLTRKLTKFCMFFTEVKKRVSLRTLPCPIYFNGLPEKPCTSHLHHSAHTGVYCSVQIFNTHFLFTAFFCHSQIHPSGIPKSWVPQVRAGWVETVGKTQVNLKVKFLCKGVVVTSPADWRSEGRSRIPIFYNTDQKSDVQTRQNFPVLKHCSL